jgi:hypothetical protein
VSRVRRRLLLSAELDAAAGVRPRGPVLPAGNRRARAHPGDGVRRGPRHQPLGVLHVPRGQLLLRWRAVPVPRRPLRQRDGHGGQDVQGCVRAFVRLSLRVYSRVAVRDRSMAYLSLLIPSLSLSHSLSLSLSPHSHSLSAATPPLRVSTSYGSWYGMSAPFASACVQDPARQDTTAPRTRRAPTLCRAATAPCTALRCVWLPVGGRRRRRADVRAVCARACCADFRSPA